MKVHVGVDPEGFLEAGGQHVGGDLVAPQVDVGVSADAIDRIAAALQFVQRPLALRRDVGGETDEDDATARVG